MGKSCKSHSNSLDECYPTLHNNHKNDKNRSKTSRFAKNKAANTKEQLKLDRKEANKIITKSRNKKRCQKEKESGIRTAQEEKEASELADYADHLLYEELKINLERWERRHISWVALRGGYIRLNHWDDLDKINHWIDNWDKTKHWLDNWE